MGDAAEQFLRCMAEHTVRLVAQDPIPGYPRAGGSGFIWQRDSDLILITAGHNFDKAERWYVETSVEVDGRVLLIPVPPVTRLVSLDIGSGDETQIDVAWARIRKDDIRAAVGQPRAPKGIELPIYRGPIDQPVLDEAYGFAAWSRIEVDDNLRTAIRDSSFELGMEFRGRSAESGQYEFTLARQHQGHDYYYGASGAPIADSTGKIVSILLGGDENCSLLRGAPLADYLGLMKLD